MSHSYRIALLTYRGNEYCGGQGVYVRHLSRELVRLGHHVEVLAGPPYPALDEGPVLRELPSLDLYAEPDPFRVPALGEYRDLVDVLEFGLMCTGGFPEPLTFSLRALRELRTRRGEFDVVHDNQTLAYGTLALQASGWPLVTTIHHPITVDRRLALEAAETPRQRWTMRRWYGFVGMQGRVARRLRHLVTVSQSSRDDIGAAFRIDPERVRVVPVGVDHDSFRPDPTIARVPGRIVSTASADSPLKGGEVLLEAVAKLRTERDVHLILVGSPKPGGTLEAAVDRFGLSDVVEFRSQVDEADLVALLNSARVVAVPSRYEGFSLPAIEAMACGTPLVATEGGALPEVVGTDGSAGLLVPVGDAGSLAGAIAQVLDDDDLAGELAQAGRARVLDRFTWQATARHTVAAYEEAMGC